MRMRILVLGALPLAACVGNGALTNPVAEGLTTSFAAVAYNCSTQFQIPQTECEALVALYNSTGGPGWSTNTNWLATSEPCLWHGVGCSGGSVIQLILGSNQLSGTIPAELGNLSNLANLILDDNQLSGIPAGLGNLSNLGVLNVTGNQLSGTIPAEVGNLSNLKQLRLGSNQLSGTIPAELGNLSNLVDLILDRNQLSGTIPAELGNLSNLANLILDDNQLSGLVPIEVAILGGSVPPLLGICRFVPGNNGLFLPDTQPYRDADLDGDGRICGLALTLALSPEQRVQLLIADVQALVAAGTLGENDAKPLLTKLEKALADIAKGKTNGPVGKLGAFINQVSGYMPPPDPDRLTPEQGQALIAAAQSIIDQLSP